MKKALQIGFVVLVGAIVPFLLSTQKVEAPARHQ